MPLECSRANDVTIVASLEYRDVRSRMQSILISNHFKLEGPSCKQMKNTE